MSKCKFCLEESDDGYDAPPVDKCYKHCRAALDGKHVPDPASIVSADDAGQNRGTDWLVDVRCKHCSQSGSTRIDPKQIQWD